MCDKPGKILDVIKDIKINPNNYTFEQISKYEMLYKICINDLKHKITNNTLILHIEYIKIFISILIISFIIYYKFDAIKDICKTYIYQNLYYNLNNYLNTNTTNTTNTTNITNIESVKKTRKSNIYNSNISKDNIYNSNISKSNIYNSNISKDNILPAGSHRRRH